MTEQISILIIAVFFFFFSRTLIRILNKYDYGVDLHYHFYNISLIRQNGNKLVKSIQRTKFGTNNSYPFFFHFLLSFVKEEKLKTIEKIFAPFLDSIVFFLVGILFIHQIRESNINYFENNFFLFLLTILFCPLLNEYNPANFRNFHANPRIFSQFIFSIFVLVYILETNLSANYIIFFLVLLITILSITSKFSNQLLVFLTISLPFFSEYKIPLVILMGYLISFIIFRKNFINILIGQIKHSFWWYKYYLPQYIEVHRNSSFSIFFYLKNFTIKNFIPSFFSSDLFLIKIIRSHILIFPIIFCYINNFEHIKYNQPIIFSLSKILLSLYLISIVVYQKRITFLGEYYRYIEFFIFFEIYIFFSLGTYLNQYTIISFSFVYILIGIFNYLNSIKKNLNQNNKSKWQEVKNGLKLIDKKKNLIYCLSNLNWMVLYYSQNICLPYFAVNMDIKKFREKRFKDLYGNKNLKPTKKFEYLKKKYLITHVIAYKDDFKIYNNLFLNDYKKKIIFNGKYINIVEL